MTERAGLVALFLSSALFLGCGGSAPAPETANDEDDGPPPTFAIALRFEDAGGDEANPRTRVSLVRIAPDGERTVADLGEEVGPCYVQPEPDTLVAGRCWWAGVGVRYRVEREAERVVAHRAVEDETEAPGPFEEVGEVELPVRARVDVLGPGAPADP